MVLQEHTNAGLDVNNNADKYDCNTIQDTRCEYFLLGSSQIHNRLSGVGTNKK